MMVDARERLDEGLFDDGEFPHRDVAIGELSEVHPLLDDGADGHLDILGGMVLEGTGGSLGTVGDHDDGGDPRLRRRAEVGIVHDVGFPACDAQRLVEEIFDGQRPVVFFRDVRDDFGKMIFDEEFVSVLCMRADDVGREVGRELAVDVVVRLVLGETLGILELADVMVVGGGTGELGIFADGDGTGLGELGDDERMVEGAGGLFLESVEKGRVRRSQLTETEDGQLVEEEFEDGQKRKGKDVEIIASKKLNVEQTEKLIEKILIEENKPKRKKKIFFKDIKIFVNTINHAVETMQSAGISAVCEKTENDECITFTVKVPKKEAMVR